MSSTGLTIGQLAKRVGIAAKTLRYYEQAGLLPEPARTDTGYRLYSETDVRRGDLVRRAKALGLNLGEIRELLVLASTGTCDDFQGEFLETLRNKRSDVKRRMADLQKLDDDLRMLEMHLMQGASGHPPDHVMLQCSPETCSCMGGSEDGRHKER